MSKDWTRSYIHNRPEPKTKPPTNRPIKEVEDMEYIDRKEIDWEQVKRILLQNANDYFKIMCKGINIRSKDG